MCTYIYIYISMYILHFVWAIRSIPHPSSHHRLWKVETEIVARFAKKRQALFGCSVCPFVRRAFFGNFFGYVWMVAAPPPTFCFQSTEFFNHFIPQFGRIELRIGLRNGLIWGSYCLHQFPLTYRHRNRHRGSRVCDSMIGSVLLCLISLNRVPPKSSPKGEKQ